jgi:hypothetical protein
MDTTPQTTDSTSRPASFLKLMRTEDAENLLLRFPNAFLLLTLIAWRARRAGEKCKWTGLEQGQAMVGDHDSCRLSRQKYRTAQSNLQTLGLATFKATNKGTIATICNAHVYDINAGGNNHQDNQRITNGQPSNNHQITTNKNVNNDKNEKKGEGNTPEHPAFQPEELVRKELETEKPKLPRQRKTPPTPAVNPNLEKLKALTAADVIEEFRDFVRKNGLEMDGNRAMAYVTMYLSFRNENDWIKANNRPVLNWKLDFQTWANGDIFKGKLKKKGDK